MKKNILTKIIALILTLLLAISFAGCNNTNNENVDVPNNNDISNSDTTDKTIRKIGVNQFALHPSLENCYTGFVQGLADSGFVDGENIKIELQNAQTDLSMANAISNSFVSQNYDLICGIATPSAQSAYNNAQSKDIPVVFVAVSDPIGAEIVKSLESPGTNVTGTADSLPIEAQLKMIREFLPNATKIGILYTLSEINSTTQIDLFKQLAPAYGFEIVSKGINETKDIQAATDVLLREVDCLNNLLDNTIVNSLPLIIEKSKAKNIPVFGSEEEQLKVGCVATEGIDYITMGIESGKMAARILNGEKASDIPVAVTEASSPFVNRGACEALGITVPESYANAPDITTAE